MKTLLKVECLKKYFPVKGSFFSRKMEVVHAVDGVDFEIKEKETLGLVGESGCGKTTIGRLLLRLIEPTAGIVRFNGQNILNFEKEEIKKIRREMQIIFQDPFSSLNPRKTVRQILIRPYKIHGIAKENIEERLLKLVDSVGLSPPDIYIDRYPHEFSGGQRQRIGIARSLALHPKFIVADEPVSALDVSIRAQILNLMKKLKETHNLTYLFITHDLSVVRSVCEKVAVMYLGKLVEIALVDDLYNNPIHPYTKAILSANPIPDPEKTRARKRIVLRGEVPSPINPPSGCRFHTRCPSVMSKCRDEEPELIEVEKTHFVACHL